MRTLIVARRGAHVTQAEMGRRLGMSQTAVSWLELSPNPGLATIDRYAEALGLRVVVTLAETGDQIETES